MRKQKYPYEDLISLPHPVSKKHPPMARENRAAQFAPFAALTGHKESIIETERLTEERKILDENRKMLLDENLQEIMQRIKQHPSIKVTYFKEDDRKEGGCYLTVTKEIRRIDEGTHTLIFMDKTSISIDDIYEIERIRLEEEGE